MKNIHSNADVSFETKVEELSSFDGVLAGAQPRKNGMNRKRVGELVFYWCILLIPLIQFFLMYIVVNFNSFVLAFKEYTYDTINETLHTEWVGFKNFKQFFVDLTQETMMGERFLYSFISYLTHLACGTVLAIFFSYYLYKKYPLTNFFRVTLMIPTVISSIVVVILYNNVVESIVPVIFDIEAPMRGGSKLQTLYIVMIGNIFMGFGSGTLMYSNAMSRIPDSLVEYAQLEGCSPAKEFFLITLPLAYPTIETFLITGIANIFVNQENLFGYFGKISPVETVGYYLFVQVADSGHMVKYPYASSVGLALTAVTIPIVMIARKLLDKLDQGAEF